MSAPSVTMPQADIRWDLPGRGHVGMYCLIAAEAAIFTIFVVAYIFYIGKSLTGPQPQDVLRVPIFFTICLHAFHVAVVLLALATVSLFTLFGQVRPAHAGRVEVLSMYWHFVDVVWVVVFIVVYIVGR